jgi:hypothetical protein
MASLPATRLSISATGQAPASLVWERYAKPALWSSWSPQISRVECADEVIRVSTTGVVHTILGVRVPFRVTAVDYDAMTWSWIAKLPLGVTLRLRHTVEARTDGTWTGLDAIGFLPIVVGYLPLARLALGRLVKAAS